MNKEKLSCYIKNFLKILINLKFSLPKKNQFLILDNNSLFLKDVLNIQNKYTLLNIRYEEFYLPLIIKTLINFPIKSLFNFYFFYLKTSIIYISPKTVLTYIHNNEIIWNICRGLDIKLIIFQNGFIDPEQIIPNKLNASENCIFLTLNKERAEIIKNNGLKAFPFGSVQSNSIKILKTKDDKKKLIFVSQIRFPNQNNFNPRTFEFYPNLTHEEFFSYDKLLLDITYEFTKLFNLELIFLSTYSNNLYNKLEKEFFSIDKYNLIYKKRILNLKDKFKFIDNCHMIIGVDSSLLYEAHGRGLKTFFGTFRGYREKNKSLRPFLNNTNGLDHGDFWTNKYDKKLILSILEKMYISNKKSFQYENEIPYYNPVNLKMINSIVNNQNLDFKKN